MFGDFLHGLNSLYIANSIWTAFDGWDLIRRICCGTSAWMMWIKKLGHRFIDQCGYDRFHWLFQNNSRIVFKILPKKGRIENKGKVRMRKKTIGEVLKLARSYGFMNCQKDRYPAGFAGKRWNEMTMICFLVLSMPVASCGNMLGCRFGWIHYFGGLRSWWDDCLWWSGTGSRWGI